MGFDSIEPYFKHAERGLFLLCRTSNPGGSDLQAQRLAAPTHPAGADAGAAPAPELLYEHVARLAAGPWNQTGQLGLVVGATFPAEIARVRALAPGLPLLIPGVGAQGGDAAATVAAGWRTAGTARPRTLAHTSGAIVVNSSRAVLYASAGADFAAAARQVAQATRAQLNAATGA